MTPIEKLVSYFGDQTKTAKALGFPRLRFRIGWRAST